MEYGDKNLEYVTVPKSSNGTYPGSKQVMCPCGHLCLVDLGLTDGTALV